MSNADIDYIEGELRLTTSPGSKVKPWPPTSGHWKNAWDRLESLRTTPPPPPPPPPPNSKPLGIYLDPSAWSVNYSTEWDAAKAAIPALDFAMSPLDSSVVTHVGYQGQWCLVPAGMTAASFTQYGLPCWQTGLVAGFVVVDEPGSDSGSVALIKTVAAFVKAACTGVNKQGQAVKTAVTQYDPATLTALAQDQVVDVLIVDAYPARPSWNMATWNACVASCDAAVSAGQIVAYGVVLDAFTAPNYPAPTQAQLEQQIAAALASNASWLIIYAWGQTGGTPLNQLPGLIAALNTIP